MASWTRGHFCQCNFYHIGKQLLLLVLSIQTYIPDIYQSSEQQYSSSSSSTKLDHSVMVSATDENEHRRTIVHTVICQKPMIDAHATYFSSTKLETTLLGVKLMFHPPNKKLQLLVVKVMWLQNRFSKHF